MKFFKHLFLIPAALLLAVLYLGLSALHWIYMSIYDYPEEADGKEAERKELHQRIIWEIRDTLKVVRRSVASLFNIKIAKI